MGVVLLAALTLSSLTTHDSLARQCDYGLEELWRVEATGPSAHLFDSRIELTSSGAEHCLWADSFTRTCFKRATSPVARRASPLPPLGLATGCRSPCAMDPPVPGRVPLGGLFARVPGDTGDFTLELVVSDATAYIEPGLVVFVFVTHDGTSTGVYRRPG